MNTALAIVLATVVILLGLSLGLAVGVRQLRRFVRAFWPH
jgi:uncharacterized protein YneF (UPF0154 family)